MEGGYIYIYFTRLVIGRKYTMVVRQNATVGLLAVKGTMLPPLNIIGDGRGVKIVVYHLRVHSK